MLTREKRGGEFGSPPPLPAEAPSPPPLYRACSATRPLTCSLVALGLGCAADLASARYSGVAAAHEA